MDELKCFKQLLQSFARLPKFDTDPTLLEICQYPYNRREEVYSRILKFFFNPNAEHGLRDLWIKSLLDAVGKSELHSCRQEVSVKLEEVAYSKRIDITIVADNYVVAIENKVTADVYNPFDVYKSYIDDAYKGKESVLLVLSMNPILNLNSIVGNNFKRCSYDALFESVSRHIGDYILNANQKYLIFMFDFIKTIKNMSNSNSKLERDFFIENRTEIEKLIGRFEQFKERLRENCSDQTKYIREEIARKTGDQSWWIWGRTDLLIEFNKETHKIGIESWFVEENSNPCARYSICISTWKVSDYLPYKDAVMRSFSSFEDFNPREDYGGNRVRVYLTDKIPGDKSEKIVDALNKVYVQLKSICQNQN